MLRHLVLTGFISPIISLVVFSQQPDYVRGKVTDSRSLKPVPFATVRLKNSQAGVLTNADGDFRILNSSRFENDSLIITCIGYHRRGIAFNNLDKSGINNLKLKENIYSLQEVKIFARKRKLSSIAIITRALKNILKNNPEKPFSYVSYYRDYQKDSSNYINLNEAIIQTLDKGFASISDSNRYRLLDFKKNMDFSRTKMTPYYDLPETDHSDESFKKIPHARVGDQNGNELFILLVHDAIRNFDKRSFSFIDTLNHNFLKNHRFSNPVGVYDGNMLLYRIDFIAKQQVTGDSVYLNGAIFIQPDDYSIHRIEYSGSFLSNAGKKKKEIFNIEIEYGHEPAVNSRMCLKYISFNNSFTIPDSTDNNFFKIIKSEWKNPLEDMTIITYFNRKLDPVLSGRKENFNLTIGKRKAVLKKVWVSGSNLFMTVRKDQFKRKELDSCHLTCRNLKDINGNVLNKKRDLEFRQYRELFVQEYNKPLDFQNDCFIESLPLEKNCLSRSAASGRFWMNTPLKAEEMRKDSSDQ